MTGGKDTAGRREPGLLRGLSGKVLVMTILFVMLGEVLIFLPSIANFRIQWLKGRVAQAEIAALAAEAAPDRILSPDLRTEILKGAGVLVVSLTRGETRKLMLRSETDHMIDASYDLRDVAWPTAIADAFAVLLEPSDRVIGVTDKPPNMSGDMIEVALFEKPLRDAMLRFGFNVFLLSVVLSVIVAGLVYLALNLVLIRPIKRLTRNMMAFAQDPENRSRIIEPSQRKDEIGLAERQLHDMQSELAAMLQQKSRLAALGLAVAKVSHDLRNMLSSAHVISDRLAMAEDPTVKRFAPKLIISLDRAISFLTETLKFGRAEEAPPMRERLPLKDIAEEVIDTAVLQASSRVVLFNHVPPGLLVDADREHLNRVLTNLLRNAIQALEQQEGEAGRPRHRLVLARGSGGGDRGQGQWPRHSGAGAAPPVRGLPECGQARRRGTGARHRGGADPRPWRRDQARRNRARGHRLPRRGARCRGGTPPGPPRRAQPGVKPLCFRA